MNAQRPDSYESFKFRVKWDGRYVAGVNNVSALRSGTEAVAHREGADTSAPRRAPGRTGYEAILLERGITYDTDFQAWANTVSQFGAVPARDESLREFREDLVLESYDEAGQLAISYKLFRCWVSEFRGIPEPDANSSAMTIDHLRLENEGWERDLDDLA